MGKYGDKIIPAYDIVIKRGVQYSKTALWRMKASPYTPYDFSGFTARMEMRKEPIDPLVAVIPAADLVLTDTDGITLGGTDGTLSILISPERTKNLPISGIYEIRLYKNSVPVLCFLHGSFSVEETVVSNV